MAPLTAADRNDPYAVFARWLADARAAGAVLPEAMALATADAGGMPDARMVMVRGVDRRGFVFFTDRQSAKGEQLRVNPRATLLAYWRELGRQVRVSGAVTETEPAEDDAAFGGRPRDAQIAVAAWRQGARIAGAGDLRAAVRNVERRLEGGSGPRPARWGGYRLIPERFVFWQERPDRAHVREAYQRANGRWRRSLLAP